MRAKSIVLICIALGCGLVASIGISQVMDGKNKVQPQGVEMGKIFVAARSIDIADPFKPDNVRLEPWPRGKIPEGAITDLKQLEGQYARTRLYAGEPIRVSKLMDKGGGLPDTVPPGYRVMAIKVNMVTAISGLLKPGDRVDIIAVLRRSRDIPQTQTKLVLEAVRIFAVNAQTERFVDERGKTIDAKTISVLVKNSQVAPLIMASELGTLRLTMRGRKVDPKDDKVTEQLTVDNFMGGGSDLADDKRKFAALGKSLMSGGKWPFGKFLQTNSNSTSTPTSVPTRVPEVKQPPIVEKVVEKEERGFRMEVRTPDGVQTYEMKKGKMVLVTEDELLAEEMEDTRIDEKVPNQDEVDSKDGNDDDNQTDPKEREAKADE